VCSALQQREQLIAKLATIAGMRPGEIFALRWADVSEDFVEVKRRVYEGVLDSPKSERGFRKVALAPAIRDDMAAWRQFSSEGFVFPSERGTPLSKHNVWRRNMQPKLKTVGLEWCTFQVMRRTFVTLSKLAGGDPKVIADQAGHDIGVSVNVYTQSPVESKLKVVSAVEKLIFG
jgi:integrase